MVDRGHSWFRTQCSTEADADERRTPATVADRPGSLVAPAWDAGDCDVDGPPDGSDELTGALVGSTLAGRYRVLRRIGQGGVGAVFEAEHLRIGKRVAIKVLLDHHRRSSNGAARMHREAQLASSIGNQHIVDITDFGETDDGRAFVVMEYLEGETLGARIDRDAPLAEAVVIDLGLQIAGALAAAHGKGIVHRDVKPDNVFLLQREHRAFVKVVDFGLSKTLEDGANSPRLTATGAVLGTPLYMAPEQVAGEEVDHRADIYAMGVILYEMCTGEVPFPGRSFTAVATRILHEEPSPPRNGNPALSEELQAIIFRAMRKVPSERYSSMEELIAHLEALRSDRSSRAAQVALRGLRRPRRRRSRSIGLAVSALALGGAAWAVSTRPSLHREPAAAGAARLVPPEEHRDPLPAPGSTRSRGAVASRPAPPALARTTPVLLQSIPPGAVISDGERVLGTAPVTIELPVDMPVTYTARLRGHRDAQLVVDPARSDSYLFRLEHARLRATDAGRRSTLPTPGRAAGIDDTAGGELTGNPYE